MFAFDVIEADPPWRFELYSEKGEEKSPQAQYACMSLDDIKALPVGHLCGSDSWLFLWTIAPMLDAGFDVLRAWGYVYVTRLTWAKVTVNGKPRMGPGYVARTLDETVLVAKIGRPKMAKPLPSLFQGVAREHSRKPDEQYPLIEACSPGPYLEMFARQSFSDKWDTWGQESDKFQVGGGIKK